MTIGQRLRVVFKPPYTAYTVYSVPACSGWAFRAYDIEYCRTSPDALRAAKVLACRVQFGILAVSLGGTRFGERRAERW